MSDIHSTQYFHVWYPRHIFSGLVSMMHNICDWYIDDTQYLYLVSMLRNIYARITSLIYRDFVYIVIQSHQIYRYLIIEETTTLVV